MEQGQRSFIPAAGHDWLLPLYDPLLRVLRADAAKRPLIEEAHVEPDHRILDIGCGTASLTVLIKRLHPGAEVFGLDPDPKALVVARRKVEDAGVEIQLDEGFSDRLPYPDAGFDRVFSSFMFHHLSRDVKLGTLAEVRRVLRVGGSFHLLDFGPPAGRFGQALVRLLHRSEHIRDTIEGRLPLFMREAGFSDVEETSRRTMVFGSVSRYRGSVAEVATRAGAL